jgi:UDP-glucose 4-epimerase
VTGGAGFIGSHIVSKLVNLGYTTFVIDNFHTGNENNLKDEIDNIKIFKGNVNEINKFELPKIDVIFHYGIYSSTPMYRLNPFLTAEVVKDAIALLEFAKNNNSKLIIASSSSIYNGLPLPWKENMQPIVTDLYTEGRIAIERLAKLYHDWYRLKVVILRLFSVYGPREEHKKKFANNVSQFLWRIMKDQPPVVYGDGTQTRDFIFIEDVIRANLLAMEEDLEFETLNIGTGRNKSFNEVISLLNKKLGKSIQPTYVQNPLKGYVYHTLADTTKANEVLGFKAKTELEDGIDELIKYYKTLSVLPDV